MNYMNTECFLYLCSIFFSTFLVESLILSGCVLGEPKSGWELIRRVTFSLKNITV